LGAQGTVIEQPLTTASFGSGGQEPSRTRIQCARDRDQGEFQNATHEAIDFRARGCRSRAVWHRSAAGGLVPSLPTVNSHELACANQVQEPTPVTLKKFIVNIFHG
jgi:hypothetical protein